MSRCGPDTGAHPFEDVDFPDICVKCNKEFALYDFLCVKCFVEDLPDTDLIYKDN